jgi:hypothetical protein
MSQPKRKIETYSLLGGINSKVSQYVNGPMEFRDLSNLNFREPGSLKKRDGSSLYLGATVQGAILSGTEFEKLSGSSYLIVNANTNAYSVTNSYTAIRTNLTAGTVLDYVTFVDRLFAANGSQFFKFDGTNSTNFSLPPGSGTWGVTAVVGGGLSGIFVVSYGYKNDRGYYGPAADGITITLNGVTFGTVGFYGLTTPAGFGISALTFFRSEADGVDLTGTTETPAPAATFNDNAPLGVRLDSEALYFTLAPRYLELFNNQLFMGGFSTALSTVFWSEIGEPEQVQPESFAEFRTNDGDRITGMKSYLSGLVVFKENSFHKLSGQDPTNFSIDEITDEYGCISNEAIVVWEDYLWFLDRKGIVQFDGANVKIVSNRVEPIFRSMNIDAARDYARGIHYRKFNEVWFAIPINGATLNNCVVVYDYVADAWTKYEGVNVASLFLAQGSFNEPRPFYGGYTGTISYFDENLYNDNGAPISCVATTSWLAPLGKSTEQLFRRTYIDVNRLVGLTQAITLDFYSNFGTTLQATRTVYQSDFQTRVDYGIAGRALQTVITHTSASLPIVFYGWTNEVRELRPT